MQKCSILDVRLGSKYPSDLVNIFIFQTSLIIINEYFTINNFRLNTDNRYFPSDGILPEIFFPLIFFDILDGIFKSQNL